MSCQCAVHLVPLIVLLKLSQANVSVSALEMRYAAQKECEGSGKINLVQWFAFVSSSRT